MRFTKKFGVLAAALAVGVMGGSVARAASVTATFTSVANEKDVHFHLDGLGDPFVAVGSYLWQGTATNPAGLQGGFATFCIDFRQDINYGQQYQYTTASLDVAPQGGSNPAGGMGDQRADAIRELWGLHYGDIGTDTDKVAGFQMAIWEIVNEAPGQALTPVALDLSSGNFYATDGGAATTYGNAYLASLFSGGSLRNDALSPDLVALTSDSAQDQVVFLPGTSFAALPVPLPSSAAGGAGLLGLVGMAVAAGRRRGRVVSATA